MKLFELYQQNTQQGTTNLQRISEAVENETGAVITVGSTQVKLGSNSAKYVLGLYETAVANGTSEQFLEGLADMNPAMVTENDNTMRHIVSKYKHEVKNFLAGEDLDNDLYEALFDYYSDHGEMPYGVAKGRDGDPFEWVTMRFDRDVHDYSGESNPDVPAMPGTQLNNSFSSLGEAKKMKEGWDDMMADVKKRAEKEKQEKGTGKFDKKSTSTGTVYSRKYDAKSGETEEPKQSASGEEKEKRGRGRPRVRPVADPATKRGRGRPRKHAAPDASAPKRGRGRPKKVREWIETLRFVSEGTTTKTATGVKHSAKGKYGGDEDKEHFLDKIKGPSDKQLGGKKKDDKK
jgi:hypothetical protein